MTTVDGNSLGQRITVPPSGPVPDALLLDAADVGASGFDRVISQDLGDIPVFENPDPRGPCGAVTSSLPLDGAIGRAFQSKTSTLIQLVMPRTELTDRYVDEQFADLRPGCAAFTSMNNEGAKQLVTPGDVLAIDDRTFAFSAVIDVGVQTARLTAALVERESHIAVLTVIEPPDAGSLDVMVLLDRTASRLDDA